MPVTRILSDMGFLSDAQVAELEGSADGVELLRQLVEKAVLSEPQALQAMSRLYRMPLLATVEEEHLDPDLVRNLPVQWARRHAMLPVRHEGRTVVLTDNPDAIEELEYLSLLLHTEADPVLCPRTGILSAIERCYVKQDSDTGQFIRDMEEGPSLVRTGAGEMDLLSTVDQAPVTQLVNMVLLEAVKRDASDIHVEPFEDRLQIRYRIDGLLYERPAPPKHLQQALVSRLKVMARLDIAEKRLPQDGMTKVRVGEREIDIRVSSVPVAEGERIVLRLLSRASTLLPMESLGFSGDMLTRFRKLIMEPQGIILVTGPTGSGKTTTLYSGLRELDTKRLNIITIEDPVEYQLDDIGQIQVRPRIGLTFAGGLRHILRQDPDIILVGETRDLETAEIAVRAALTGHLVFTTLHTNDAVSAPLRMVDMGIQPYLLSEALKAVLAQRLVRKLCTACRRSAPWTQQDTETARGKLPPGGMHYLTGACPLCREGYRGRTGLFEFLRVDGPVQDAVRENAGVARLRELGRASGWAPLFEEGLRAVFEGRTTLDELVRITGFMG